MGERELQRRVIKQAMRDFADPKESRRQDITDWVLGTDIATVCDLAGVPIGRTLKTFAYLAEVPLNERKREVENCITAMDILDA